MNKPRKVSYDEQLQKGLVADKGPRFVAAEIVPVVPKQTPTNFEVVDPLAHAPGFNEIQIAASHHYTPISRAKSMLIKTSAITGGLAVFTLGAMIVFAEFYFFMWLVLASFEWVFCFCLLAVLDYRETPNSVQHKKVDGYLELLRIEQRARLKSIYGYQED
jgi:hypothetical protein